jgi:single-stranded-DNA-specific exonuclease
VERRWFVQRTNPEYVSYLAREAAISPTVAQILINRGLKSPKEVSVFFNISVEDLDNPLALDGLEQAMDAVERARREGLRIMVHGDYDADGLTASAIMTEALRALGLDVFPFIPNRFEHGYGFNPPSVDLASREGAGLIITVDCGITSFEAAEHAARHGIDVVITDHHEPVIESGRPRLPKAMVTVNPKLSNPEIAMLSGAGVALKFAQALAFRYPDILNIERFLDLAALGTLADSVPLMGENRAIVKGGVEAIFEGRRPGIKALGEVSRLVTRQTRADILNFTLVPRLNAAGRLSDANVALELLLSDSEDRSRSLAEELDAKNLQRQRIEEDVLNEALAMINKRGVTSAPALVLAGEGWHEGVVGIVASRIVERFNRPAVVLSVNNGVAKGSARSIPQFNIHDGLTRCAQYLSGFGGHRQAAGVRLNTSDIEAFERSFCKTVEQLVDDFTPTLNLDAAVKLRDVTFKLVGELQRLAPFGYGNPEPVLGVRGLDVVDARIVGSNHLKLKLRSASFPMDAIGFDMGDLLGMVEDTKHVDAAFCATINEWEGGRTLQMNLKGLRPS